MNHDLCSLVFRVKLRHDKRCYRDIQINSDRSFSDFHDAIFSAFDRDDPHMYSFFLPGIRIEGNSDSFFFGRKSRDDDDDDFDENTPIDQWPERDIPSHKLSLGRFRYGPKFKFSYLFDYGDEWWHEVEFREERPYEANWSCGHTIKSNRPSPPQYPNQDDEEEAEDEE